MTELEHQRECFYRALRLNPFDEVERLIFADWCEEQGEPENALELRSGRIPLACIEISALFKLVQKKWSRLSSSAQNMLSLLFDLRELRGPIFVYPAQYKRILSELLRLRANMPSWCWDFCPVPTERKAGAASTITKGTS